MAEVTSVDLPTLEQIAGQLSRVADALDAVGKASPGPPDAGEVSGLMAAALAHLTEGAGNLVLGMKVAGEEASEARRKFENQDEAAAQSFWGP
ncbi:hypothetical protein [Actinoplanes sp. HUAS TT8]|uniref:hypothetical protein n=1 Tax=Actinoplanes sp. HUAS TT8 TaxID=3447453 RepID=UPI003F5259F0